jgi:hypothetical protein
VIFTPNKCHRCFNTHIYINIRCKFGVNITKLVLIFTLNQCLQSCNDLHHVNFGVVTTPKNLECKRHAIMAVMKGLSSLKNKHVLPIDQWHHRYQFNLNLHAPADKTKENSYDTHQGWNKRKVRGHFTKKTQILQIPYFQRLLFVNDRKVLPRNTQTNIFLNFPNILSVGKILRNIRLRIFVRSPLLFKLYNLYNRHSKLHWTKVQTIPERKGLNLY